MDVSRLATALVTGAVVVLLAACGSVPSGAAPASTAPPAPAPDQAMPVYCETWVSSDVAVRRLLQAFTASPTPEQIRSAIRSFWAEQEPILTSLAQEVPAELRGEVEPILRLARDGQVTGGLDTISAPEADRSDRVIDEFMLRECPYPHVTVSATDETYVDAPTTLDATTIALILTNRGQDAHQIIVSLVDPSENRPFRDILADATPGRRLPITPIALVAADPGDTRAVFVPLVPGRYGWYDSLPRGTMGVYDPNRGKGPPHFTLGLVHEIVVRP